MLSADDGMLVMEKDPQNILEPLTNGGYLCSDPISTYFMTQHMHNPDDTKAGA